MGHTAFNQQHQRRGYTRLIGIPCDCGQPAKRQVQVQQFNSHGKQVMVVLPLCDDCYRLMLAEDRGIVHAW